ncbi:hypothetical protein TWF132_007647 [Orbilia oligospora]|nr:hypothetical protein TWF132_007647 [Orbilia oligospora]
MAPSKSFILYFIALFFAILPSEGHLVGTKTPNGFPGARDILEGRDGELGSYSEPLTPISLGSWSGRAKWKRNDEDTDMEDASDDFDEVMENLNYDDDVDSGESVLPVKQLIIERFNKGNLVEMQFAEKSAAIPAQDPKFDPRKLEKAFPSHKHMRGVSANIADVTHRMIAELNVDRFNFENRRTYGLIKRVEVDAGGQPVAGGKELLTYISKKNQHLYFENLKERFPDDGVLRDWIYQCWVKGSDPDEGDSRVPLKFITFRDYHDKDSFYALKRLSKEWGGFGYPREIDAGFIVHKGDLDSRLSAAYPDGNAGFRSKLLTTFHGIPMVSIIVEMLSTFPNAFQRYQVSAIGFEVWEGAEPGYFSESTPSQHVDDSSPESGPHFNIVIKLDRRLEPLEIAPGGGGVRINITSGGLASFADLSKHPYHADISRTSYGLNENPTFTKLKVAFFGTEYSFAISRLEKHIVFDMISAETPPVGAIILQPKGRNPIQDFVDVLYSTWNREAGQAILMDLTFGHTRRTDKDKIMNIRNQRKPKDDDEISVFSKIDDDFNSVYQDLKEVREGKVLEDLIRRYGENLGVSGISRIEIGVFTKQTAVLRAGDPFILVGFRPVEKYSEEVAIRGQSISLGSLANSGDIGMAEVDEEAAPNIPSTKASNNEPKSFEEQLWGAFQRGCQNQAWDDFVRIYPLLELGPHANDNVPDQGYKFTLKSDNTDIGANQVGEILEYLMALQAQDKQDRGLKAPDTRFKRISKGFNQPRALGFFLPTTERWFQKDTQTAKRRLRTYQLFEVERKTSTRNTDKFRVFRSKRMEHLAVLSLSEWMSQPDFEDALIALWNDALGFEEVEYSSQKTDPESSRLPRTADGIRHVSFFSITPYTQGIIEYIYQMKKLAKGDPLMLWRTLDPRFLGGVGPHQHSQHASGYAAYHRYPPEDRISWLLLLGSPELFSVGQMIRKYRGTNLRFITAIVVRWVSTGKGENDPMRPEMVVTIDKPFTGSIGMPVYDTDKSLAPTELRGLLPSGGRHFLVNEYRGMLAVLTDEKLNTAFESLDHTGWVVSQGNREEVSAPGWAQNLLEAAELPAMSLSIKHSLRTVHDMYGRVNRAVYAEYNVLHTAQALKNSFLVLIRESKGTESTLGKESPVRGHIIVQEAIPAGSELPSIEPILSKIWLEASSIPPLLITFRKLSSITEAIVFMLWNDLSSSKWRSNPEDTASMVSRRPKIRVTTGDAYPKYVSGDRKWMLPLQAWGHTFDILMATPEGSLVSQFIQRHFDAMKSSRIVSVYVESEADGTGLKMLFDIQQRADSEPDWYSNE